MITITRTCIVVLTVGALLLALAAPRPALADERIYSNRLEGDFDTIHEQLRRELDAERFFVVKDLNIGHNLQKFAGKWGENYNRHNFSRIHAMIICNGWFANETINISPAYMSLCPLSLILLHKDNSTMLHYALREPMAGDDQVADLMRRLDKRFTTALDEAVARIQKQLNSQAAGEGK